MARIYRGDMGVKRPDKRNRWKGRIRPLPGYGIGHVPCPEGQWPDYYTDECCNSDGSSGGVNCLCDFDISCWVCDPDNCDDDSDCNGTPGGDAIWCSDGSCELPDDCPEGDDCCGSQWNTPECCQPPRPDCDTTWPYCHPATHWCNNDWDCCGNLHCDSHKCGCW